MRTGDHLEEQGADCKTILLWTQVYSLFENVEAVSKFQAPDWCPNNFDAENTQRVGATEQNFPARIYVSLIQMLTEQDIRVGTGVSWLSV
jgi:hypothetical protein